MARVEVADGEPLARRGLERLERHLLDLPVAPDRLAQGLAAVRVDAGEEPVGGEDGEPGVAERDEAHQHVRVRGARLLGVHARGLVAVVAVGDQQLGRRQRLGRRGDGLGVGDPPQPVHRAVVVGRLAERRPAEVRRERRPGVAVVEGEDRREVRPRGPRQPQPVLLRPRVRALVRPDAARRRSPRPARGRAARGGCGGARRARCSPARAPTARAPRRAPRRRRRSRPTASRRRAR